MAVDNANAPDSSSHDIETSAGTIPAAAPSSTEDMNSHDSSHIVNTEHVRGPAQKRMKVTKLSPKYRKWLRDPKRTFPWEKLPYEIRKQTFALVNDDYGSSRFSLPPTSYDHVLQWFWKQNGSKWTRPLDMYRTKMNAEEKKVIRSLELTRPKNDNEFTRAPGQLQRFTNYFSGAVNSRHITFSPCTEFNHPRHPSNMAHWITEKFGVKGRLKTTLDEIFDWGCIPDWEPIQDSDHITPWDYLNDERSPRPVNGSVQVWTWKVPVGQSMDWSQDLGWEWRFTHLISVDEPYGEYDRKKAEKELKAEQRDYWGSMFEDSSSSSEEEEEEEHGKESDLAFV
ncbi:uncharacterized protein PAC_18544 [Phialocephala subalpina]|uniref:Uncharacterized protein n=1 Tax=Phialocephala subalpina TaxID=576137 RepID=A0A1L7XUF4_9HELO|nr:uncharacterized protein PAC_18544 [Phialocephala subalpina]